MSARQSKEVLRKKRIRKILIILVVVAVVLVAAVLFTRQWVQNEFASTDADEVLSAQVTTGSISTTVSGSGTLASVDVEDVTIPASVSLDEIYVESGDTVEEGQILAAVNASSVLSSLSDLQSQLDDLDDELSDASDDAVSSTVSAGVAGRVKAIYVASGDDVPSVMAEYGALMVLSLDGYMAVDLETDAYAVGDTLTVTTSSGTEYTGTVSAVTDVTTVLITDNGPLLDDTVTADGLSGTLYIHQPLKVTGYAGTVSYISVSENSYVYSSSTLMTLTDTSYSANYDQLLVERAELEEIYQTLVMLYKDGAVYAPFAGTVDSVADIDEISSSAQNGSVTAETTLLSLNPDISVSVTISVDETDIQSLELGQEVAVTIDSIGEDSFTGTVTEIDKTATSSSGVTVYAATVTLDKTSQMLAGMSASVSITIEGVENALLVPEDAVHKTSATSYVYTTYDESTGEMGGMVEVTTGLSNGSYIEITEGLSEGDTVYYTESQSTSYSFSFGGGGMSDMSGGMSDWSNNSGGMSDRGNNSGGGMAGGGMPG